MVEVKVKIPKEVLEFLKSVHAFGKFEKPLEEWLGSIIVENVDGCLRSQFEGLLNVEDLRKTYRLKPEILDC